MKRVITLLMAAVMVIGTAGLASAIEFKVSGHMHIMMGVQDNGNGTIGYANFNKDKAEDNFYAGQRFRPKLTMKGNGVTAVFEAQQHQKYWGSDFAAGNPGADVRVRNAYIDFKIPQSPVSLKIGFQQLNLPSVMGHPIFETRVGGVLATIPFNDQVALAAFYARPNALYNSGSKEDNAIDMFGALLPLNFGTVQATPYVVYARVGSDLAWAVRTKGQTPAPARPATWEDSNDSLFVGGLNLVINPMDALSVKVDGIVSSYSSDNDAFDLGTGWMVIAAVDYEMPWGTPGVFAWYSSGADEDGEGSLWTYTGYTDGFCPTSLGAEGYNTFDEGAWVTSTGANTMGIGLQIADMSFIDSLKHTARVAYIKGTADKDGMGKYKAIERGTSTWVSEEWSFIEINFDSTWSIYENLAAVVELGALIPDLDKNYPNAGGGKANGQDDPAYRAQITFRFSF